MLLIVQSLSLSREIQRDITFFRDVMHNFFALFTFLKIIQKLSVFDSTLSLIKACAILKMCLQTSRNR